MSEVKLFAYIDAKKINLLEYAALYSLKHSIQIGSGYNVDFDRLYNEGFLSKKEGRWILTSKSNTLLKFTSSLFNDQQVSKEVDTNKLDSLIKECSSIYPTKTPDGRRIASNSKDVKAKLTRFFMNYDYEYETIIEAVKRYLDEHLNSESNGKYLMGLRYFILKGTESKLADYCEDVIENPIINRSNVIDHRFNEL